MNLDDYVLRKVIVLTPAEQNAFRKLKPVPGEAFNFWWAAARSRRLDPETVMTINGETKVTALPLGHGKEWCWPVPLKCRRKA